MKTKSLQSWGRLGKTSCDLLAPAWTPQKLPPAPAGLLAYGLGRSYGDSCLLEGGTMLETRFLDRIKSFDAASGLLHAEAGLSLDAILRFAVPRGWFLPTTPGTRFVTLGGAIANDIHGKNHHLAGCFGNHVPFFHLLRSDGSITRCQTGDPLYHATIGGLGLTGFITDVAIQLVPISSAYLNVELVRFNGVDEFLAISENSKDWEHTVAWIDCVAKGSALGRGIFIRGNNAKDGALRVHPDPKLAAPFEFPSFALNPFSIKAFNTLYYHRLFGKTKRLVQHYAPFYYPLDGVDRWNRIYGSRGFYQYQCVTPAAAGAEPMKEILRLIAESGQASFLAVLKTFGEIPSPGMLSFPRPGMTLALDFPNRCPSTLRLFESLDAIVRSCGGRLYPAKDARMTAADFHAGYPALETFRPHIDPAFTSDLWKRLNP